MDDFLRNKRVLITGAAGFVGANLTRELVKRGAEVHAIVRPGGDLWRISEMIPTINIHTVDLTHAKELRRIIVESRPEIIFNLAVRRAGRTSRDRRRTLQTNVLGTANLLEAATPLDYERFIQVGGSLEYGVKERPIRESDLPEPVIFYGATKAAATLLCQQLARADDRPVTVLRLFSVYGYWEPSGRLVPTAIMAALRGQEIPLTAPGYRRDLVFVKDVVEACLLSLRAEGVTGEIINVGSGQQWSNEEVVEMVQVASGREVRVRAGEYPPRPSDTTNWVADNRKAKQLLGWEPRHSLRAGLEQTVAWLERHQELYPERITLGGPR
jgi:nucleoside-diphosphate-sugar epimerase